MPFTGMRWIYLVYLGIFSDPNMQQMQDAPVNSKQDRFIHSKENTVVVIKNLSVRYFAGV